STENIAGASARRPWLIITLWVVLLAASALYTAENLSGAVSTSITFSSDPESAVGLEKIDEAGLSDEASIGETIVIASLTGATVDDPAFQERAEAVVSEVRSLLAEWREMAGLGPAPEPGRGSTPNPINYYELRQFGISEVEDLVSEDRRYLIVPVSFPPAFFSEVEIGELLDALEALSDDQFQVVTAGTLSINERYSVIAEEDLVRGEAIGVPIALLVLVGVLGALVAPILPILLAIFSIAIALGIVTLLGGVLDLNLFVQNMITMLGLAVGIDYALFVVARYREERQIGYSRQRSIERAGATSSKAVVFSGITVVLALAGVILIPTNLFRSLGLGAVIVVIVAVVANLTLLPAMLSILGDRINWPRRQRPGAVDREHASEQNAYEGFWGTITRVVMARPMVSAVATTTALLALALPVADIETGFVGPGSLPESDVRTAYDLLQREFSAGLLAPVEIVVEGDREEIEPALVELVARMETTDAFAPITEPAMWSEDGETVLLDTTLAVPGDSEEAYDAIRWLRQEALPETVGEVGAEAWVTGDPAFNLDFTAMVNDYTPIVFAFVLGLSFVLLLLAFRSIVVPIKAILMNLLSVGAAYGLMVLIFQKGVLADTLGFTQTPTIEAWIPIFLFCILFGLSMDYNVFLLSRIREHYDITGRNRESVAVGLRTTARIITGAALIMVVVFSAFAAGRLVMLQQIGFGLAAAVFIDATIIRSVLVPSAMVLLGDRNWYLP
ncbi:MAG: MMPL family transporter, partial [Chloroflexota bacterium]|nr:MMPL family transporter [Chloroflexota bacterium]